MHCPWLECCDPWRLLSLDGIEGWYKRTAAIRTDTKPANPRDSWCLTFSRWTNRPVGRRLKRPMTRMLGPHSTRTKRLWLACWHHIQHEQNESHLNTTVKHGVGYALRLRKSRGTHIPPKIPTNSPRTQKNKFYGSRNGISLNPPQFHRIIEAFVHYSQKLILLISKVSYTLIQPLGTSACKYQWREHVARYTTYLLSCNTTGRAHYSWSLWTAIAIMTHMP